jgi:hypothetical protein
VYKFMILNYSATWLLLHCDSLNTHLHNTHSNTPMPTCIHTYTHRNIHRQDGEIRTIIQGVSKRALQL